ncbi:MAG: replication-associated recombination protein A [Phycisphaerales bacterium]|nr:replication-associated recombination protein A [Phycisphaerales bacterium]
MSDLWAARRQEAVRAAEPLAVRMRPRTLDEVAGQRHLLGASDGRKPLLVRMLEAGTLTSVILTGPPGTGKTTLAEVIARHSGRLLVRENAANVSVKRIREIIDEAERLLGESARRTVLFLDEIHRFSRSQQDVLLEDVERGVITLIGATTENPMFAVNSALVSRSTVFRLEPLTEQDVAGVVRRALNDRERGYGGRPIEVTDEAVAHWARMAEGDARRALNALEVAVLSSPGAGPGGLLRIGLREAEESIQRKMLVYSADGDAHYDTISAMIKSVRGSDPDAAIFWLARMLEAGEDPRFIARRLAILAAEDIGNAEPRALMVAEAAWSLTERVGMPECRIILAQCAAFLSLSPKSNAAIAAIDAAMADVRAGETVPVPMFLRDRHKTPGVGSSAEGRGYEYSHDAAVRTSLGGVSGQDYLGVDKRYYQPADSGHERVLKDRLDEVRAARSRARGP